jgi:hypothetical protein
LKVLSLVRTRLQPAWATDKKAYADCVVIGDKDYHLKHHIPFPAVPGPPLTTGTGIGGGGGIAATAQPPASPGGSTTAGAALRGAGSIFSPEAFRGSMPHLNLPTGFGAGGRPLSQSFRRLTGTFLGTAAPLPPPPPPAPPAASSSGTGAAPAPPPPPPPAATTFTGRPPAAAASTAQARGLLRMPFFGATTFGSPLFGGRYDRSHSHGHDDIVSEISSRSDNDTLR